MNIARNYKMYPEQEEMLHAIYNPNIYGHVYHPFIPVDETFRRISTHIPDIREYFWVSNYGRVYNANNGYLSMPYENDQGYLIFNLKRNDAAVASGKPVDTSIAGQILVCSCFVGPKPTPRHQVNHKDFNRKNNYYQNLEWTTSQENLAYSRNAGHYWNGNVYVSAFREEKDIRKICELMESGITDPQTLSQIVFRCDVNPSLYGLFQDLRSGGWYKITKDYQIPEVEHRNFTNDNYIHAMCKYMRDFPETAYTASLESVLAYSKISVNDLDIKVKHRLASALHQLRYKGAYKKIAKQYNLPPVPNL